MTEEITNVNESKLLFSKNVITKIITMAVKNIDGIMLCKSNGVFSGMVGRSQSEGINVEVGEREVAVDLKLLLKYGNNAKDIYDRLKSTIEQEIEKMTGLVVVEVNATIEDVLSEEDFNIRNEQ